MTTNGFPEWKFEDGHWHRGYIAQVNPSGNGWLAVVWHLPSRRFWSAESAKGWVDRQLARY